MSPSDTQVLEVLQNHGHGLRATPRTIAANCDYTPGTIRGRMKSLREAGLIKYHDKDSAVYEITELGERYLKGELTDSEIDQLEQRLADRDAD